MTWRDIYYIMFRDKNRVNYTIYNLDYVQMKTQKNGSNYIKMLTVGILGRWVIDEFYFVPFNEVIFQI